MTDHSSIHWRYRPHGKVQHALVGNMPRALCGDAPWVWRANRSQRERDMLQRLPRCRRCVDALAGRS